MNTVTWIYRWSRNSLLMQPQPPNLKGKDTCRQDASETLCCIILPRRLWSNWKRKDFSMEKGTMRRRITGVCTLTIWRSVFGLCICVSLFTFSPLCTCLSTIDFFGNYLLGCSMRIRIHDSASAIFCVAAAAAGELQRMKNIWQLWRSRVKTFPFSCRNFWSVGTPCPENNVYYCWLYQHCLLFSTVPTLFTIVDCTNIVYYCRLYHPM